VPTPFYHLSVAKDLLAHGGLSAAAQELIRSNRPAFLLGNTAPDVQTVSGQTRQATHFFDLPIQPGAPVPWEQMLNEFPALAQPARLAPAQVAFLAGYICHLQADWMWVLDIFLPVFGPDAAWKNFGQRLYLHNVLRAYLDRQILGELGNGTASSLNRATPQTWLPFVADRHLAAWRDFLSSQLKPGAAVQTVEVFASRQGIAPEAYYRLLDSQARLDEEIFSHLPPESLITYRSQLLAENLRFIEEYCHEAH
jgi:hypothetical protein